ncbi:hypothetical protein B0A48_02985 [Cryoendolithus antarcticus]|uniref:Uncharacterized protein n=1 Tax=Cryoendolithus antarcticus TaxID=1507870 RepID=A0A1V8TLS2_9PEZI|nr:hypothetical protein B0A48_02985 [Cryoendolithus antarcticus]
MRLDPMTTPPFLALPLELRLEIYTALLAASGRDQDRLYELQQDLLHVDIRPPSTAELLINPQVTRELQSYHSDNSAFQLTISLLDHRDSNGPHPGLMKLRSSPLLHRIKTLELTFVLFQSGPRRPWHTRKHPPELLTAYRVEICRKTQEVCEVLSQASSLKNVSIRWRDAIGVGPALVKPETLVPLRLLPTNVRLSIGWVTVDMYEDMEAVMAATKTVLEQVVGDIVRSR